MTCPPVPRVRPLAGLALVIAAFALAGCFNPFSPRIAPGLGTSKPAPVPSSAAGVLRLFEWCYNHRAIAEYREIFTEDYRFWFSPLDSSGAEYRGTPWTREDELISAAQLFEGGRADQPPASSIRLVLDRSFVIFADPNHIRWDPTGRWHKNVRTQVVLNIQTTDGNAVDITGGANFFLVRGDSAIIPEDLRLRGFKPDSNRWYIRQWDDETAQPGADALAGRPVGAPDMAAAQIRSDARAEAVADREPRELGALPFERASWGSVKVHYRNRPVGPVLRAPVPAGTSHDGSGPPVRPSD